MAWFDYVGGLAKGVQGAASVGLEDIARRKEEKRQSIIDQRAAAQEQRTIDETGRRQALENYLGAESGTEFQADDPRVLDMIRYLGKDKFTAGRTPGTVSLLETPARREARETLEETRRRRELTQESDARKARIRKTLMDPASGFMSQSQLVRRMQGAELGLPEDAVLTEAELLEAARRTPQVLGANIGASAARYGDDLRAKTAFAVASAKEPITQKEIADAINARFKEMLANIPANTARNIRTTDDYLELAKVIEAKARKQVYAELGKNDPGGADDNISSSTLVP